MTTRLDELLDELARRYGTGEEIDMAGLLDRAGDEREVFAVLAERFLEAAPRREATPESVAYLTALREPPLLRARVARKLRVAEVVERLARALKVTDTKRLAGYYQRLEGGLLAVEPVDERVWTALSEILQAPARKLAGPATARLEASTTFFRLATAPGAPPDADPSHAGVPVAFDADPRLGARDELDRLFLGDA